LDEKFLVGYYTEEKILCELGAHDVESFCPSQIQLKRNFEWKNQTGCVFVTQSQWLLPPASVVSLIQLKVIFVVTNNYLVPYRCGHSSAAGIERNHFDSSSQQTATKS
jgi:hypothetical protein